MQTTAWFVRHGIDLGRVVEVGSTSFERFGALSRVGAAKLVETVFPSIIEALEQQARREGSEAAADWLKALQQRPFK